MYLFPGLILLSAEIQSKLLVRQPCFFWRKRNKTILRYYTITLNKKQ